MKAELKELSTLSFTPYELRIVIESQKEADAIYALFATSCLDDALKDCFGVQLPYSAVASLSASSAGACTDLTKALARHVKAYS